MSKRFESLDVLRRVSLDVAPGSVCALLGPSGSGKTTLLRVIAGLEVPDDGAVALDGQVLSSPSAWVRPEKRRIGMVFQDWALFPHLDVAGNVGYGLGRGGGRDARVGDVLEMVGLDGLDGRAPGTLSGGQQQRVALARALAPRPDVLLLDEPFSNLDVALRGRIRMDVHRLLADAGVTAVFVTHDQEEAFVLGDQVAVIRDGAIVQVDTPEGLYRHPADAWVASFVGDANLLAADAVGTSADSPLGPVELAVERSGRVHVVARPEHVAIEPGDGATVELVEYYGRDTVVVVRLDDGPSVRARLAMTTLRRHDRVAVRYAGPPAVAFETP